jgi:hypothetical protein
MLVHLSGRGLQSNIIRLHATFEYDKKMYMFMD